MRMVLLLLLLVAVAGGIAYLLLGGGDGGIGGADAERMEDEAFVPPALRGTGVEGRRQPTTRGPATPSAGESRPAPETAETNTYLEFRILDAMTGKAVPTAKVRLLLHQEPCPGPRDFVAQSLFPARDGYARIPRPFPENTALDAVVTAKGYVPAILCLPQGGAPIEVRLVKGLSLEGHVRDTTGKALPEATVVARPGPTTPAIAGHFSVDAIGTDPSGAFLLDGFLPGSIVLEVRHDDYMTRVTEPVDVPQADSLEIVLERALAVTFRITTDDGRIPEHPTLTWIRKEDPSRPNLQLLQPRGEAASVPLTCLPVKVPATSKALFLEVQADGYAPWRRMDFKPPADGGTASIDVELSSDLSTGTLRASLVDERGEAVHYADAKVRPGIQLVAGDQAPGMYVIEQGQDLRVTAMPAGTYRLRLESPAFAPVETDATITPGQETVVTIPVAPPAKMHVRFYGPENVLVRFRVLNEGDVVQGFPEGSVSRGTDEETGEEILTAGSDGITLTGLSGGTHTVEVTSDEVTASPTIVHLVQGTTVEVEVTVNPR